MKVLLVNPPPHKIVETYFDAPAFPRTALAVLAGYLREKGISVHVLDCKYDRINFEDAIEQVKTLSPHVIGFTAMTNEINAAAQFAQMVKAIDKTIITIIGGVHISARPEQCLKEFGEFDYGIINEGQESLHQLISILENREVPLNIPGVCHINFDRKFSSGGVPPFNHDLDSIYFPAWDMFRPATKYIFQTTLGCPYKCPFCMSASGQKIRKRSIGKVLDEIEMCLNLGKLNSFQFGDEAFTMDRSYARALCQGIIDRGISKHADWFCTTHLNSLNESMIQLMKRSNCFRVAIGVETGDEQIMKTMGKALTKEKIRAAARRLHKEKMPFETLFILGHPDETLQTIKETINFAVELSPTIPIFGIMVPYPGTKVRELAENGSGGYINLSSDWNDYNKHVGNAVDFELFSRRQLELLMLWGYLKVFIWNFRFMDLLMFIWNYRAPAIGALNRLLNRWRVIPR